MPVVAGDDLDPFASLPTPIPPSTAPAAAPAAAAAAAAAAAVAAGSSTSADADGQSSSSLSSSAEVRPRAGQGHLDNATAGSPRVRASVTQQHDEADSGLPHSPYHLFLGSLNALPKALLGWPLDTSKTLLQTTEPSRYPPPFRTLRVLQTTVGEHGLRGLYKGVGGPAAGWACVDAGVLGGLWKARGWLYERGWREAHEGGEERLTIGGHVLAGGMAGLMVVPLAHPIDLVKSRLQFALRLPAAAPSPASSTAPASRSRPSNTSSAARSRRLAYPNPRYYQHLRPPSSCAVVVGGAAPALVAGFFTPSSAASGAASHSQPTHGGLRPCGSGGPRYLSSVVPRPTARPPAAATAATVGPTVPLGPYGTLSAAYAQGGLLRGVYRALPWTALCRSGMGVMFGTYEVLLRAQEQAWGVAGQGGLGKAGQTFLAGAASSLVFWTVFLPADNVKATLMTDAVNPAERKFRTSRSAIAHIYSLSAPSPSSSPSPAIAAAARTSSLLDRLLARAQRLKPFWRGGGAVVARASVVNGVGLVLWEGAMNAVGERTLS